MNKLGIVLGVAAVATLAGCKDPEFQRNRASTQDEVKVIEDTKAEETPAVDETKTDIAIATTEVAPVDEKVVVPAPTPVVPAEPEYTMYIVQRGDYLAKISKKYNIKMDAIKKLNGMKNDMVRVGQKIKLPGKVDVGEQTVPAGAVAVKDVGAKTSAKKAFTPYTGATKEYVVKSGDTLGAIAYGNGINIRQLKELNGLKNDNLRIGQKLKIPAEKVVVQKKLDSVPAVAPAEKKVEAAAATAAEAPADAAVSPEAVPETPAVAPQAEEAVTSAAAAVEEVAPATYIVQEGDDITGVSLKWGVTAAAIRELNNLGDSDALVPGQAIKLPADAQQ